MRTQERNGPALRIEQLAGYPLDIARRDRLYLLGNVRRRLHFTVKQLLFGSEHRQGIRLLQPKYE